MEISYKILDVTSQNQCHNAIMSGSCHAMPAKRIQPKTMTAPCLVKSTHDLSATKGVLMVNDEHVYISLGRWVDPS